MLAASMIVRIVLLALSLTACDGRDTGPVELMPGLMSRASPPITFASAGLATDALAVLESTTVPATRSRDGYKTELFIAENYTFLGCAGRARFGFYNDMLYEIIFYAADPRCPAVRLPSLDPTFRSELVEQSRTTRGRKIRLRQDLEEKWYVAVADAALASKRRTWLRRHS